MPVVVITGSVRHEIETYYLETIDNDQPRVRPFGKAPKETFEL